MCFAPKTPKPDPALARERKEREAQLATDRSAEKEKRTAQAKEIAGGVGIRSLLSGGSGGQGFGRNFLG